MRQEFDNLQLLRGYGLAGYPHHVVRPLGTNGSLNSLLVEEYATGVPLSAFINEAIHQGQSAPLFDKLTALAYFLATLHNRTANGVVGRGLSVVAIDLERMKRADRTFVWRRYSRHRSVEARGAGRTRCRVTGAFDAMNARLVRKVERLESSFSPLPGSGPRDAVVGAALERLSTGDLLQLIDSLDAQRPFKDWSAEQVSASEALRTAMEAECLQAGFKSVAELDRLYPAATTETTLRRTGPAPWRRN
jgi:hypothetical protein